MATTLAEAILDRSVPFHWLILFEAQGFSARYAEADMTAAGHQWRGIVRMGTTPEVSANPYTGQGSAGAWSFSLLPERKDLLAEATNREYDWESVNGFSYSEATVTLYRWPEGCPLGDPISVGVVDGVTMESDGSLSFEVVSITEKYDAAFPRYCITDTQTYYTATTAAVHEDDVGRGYPILYGNFRRLECPNVDTTYLYALMAGHHCAGYTTAWRDDDDSATPTLRNTTDGSGRDVCILDFSVLGVSAIVTVTATGTDGGYADDADGTYTGTASTLILHPCDQLRHMGRIEAEIPAARIDHGSFIYGRQRLPGYEFSTIVSTDDKTSYFQVCTDVCQFLAAAVLFERGQLRFRMLDLDAFPSLTISDADILDMSLGWGDKRQTISYLRLRYEWGYVWKRKTMDYRKSVELTDTDRADLKANLARYGEKKLELETKHIYDADTADAVADRMVTLRSKLRKVVTLTVDRAAHAVNLFDVVSITTAYAPSSDGAGWADKRFVVTRIAYGLDTNTLTLLEV